MRTDGLIAQPCTAGVTPPSTVSPLTSIVPVMAGGNDEKTRLPKLSCHCTLFWPRESMRQSSKVICSFDGRVNCFEPASKLIRLGEMTKPPWLLLTAETFRRTKLLKVFVSEEVDAG